MSLTYPEVVEVERGFGWILRQKDTFALWQRPAGLRARTESRERLLLVRDETRVVVDEFVSRFCRHRRRAALFLYHLRARAITHDVLKLGSAQDAAYTRALERCLNMWMASGAGVSSK